VDEARKQESEGLVRSWMQHEAAWLRDYLVAGVEDPRINVQSVLSRHFLIQALAGERFGLLMQQEYRFAAVMNWFLGLAQRLRDGEETAALLYALRHGSDNAEGIEIPHFVLQTSGALPATAGNVTVPNYVESCLLGTQVTDGQVCVPEAALDTFRDLWNAALSVDVSPARESGKRTVLEPACGSANDYRYLDAHGIARLVDYTGFDLCAKNIENARALFPSARFEVGNVFAIDAPDNAFDLCFVHDLFEHLSLAGLETAIRETCRVTRQGLCIGFFNMDEIREHQVRPVDEYFWNTLSMARVKELFTRHGFSVQVVHVGSFLRQQIGCEHTHNPNAYTFFLRVDDQAPELQAGKDVTNQDSRS
jgi:SAM-dependent methyltransferase